ncbi:amino acid adenylation domain-containing protein [Chitinophaga oryziterrae]|uniref:Amino acid adenylation domain-containing protein n=1 Tax=Chitinophaga oryziterrae TaxID=1031224 RepID=A0A6N8JAG7_9BACT|nr:non-ribosomal peptide synthetase [Chitinophaga oryziterrae]MVT42247.1 amino acid adenylation domain-containing protein [Chitinophaga oryziterrae]
MSPLTCTVSQQLIWLDQLIAPRSSKYNIGGYASLEGSLSYPSFNKAVNEVLNSQEVYRTVFFDTAGLVTCMVNPPVDGYGMEVIDFSHASSPADAAKQWMEHDFLLPFVMENQLLFRFKLLKISDTQHFWYAKIHHLISDGWSFRLLLNQAAGIYSGEPLPVMEYRYSNYTQEDAAYYASDMAKTDRQFWMEQFSTLPADLFPKRTGGNTIVETLQLDATLKEKLKTIADNNKASLFQVIISLLLIYLSKTSGHERIAFGVPVLNRTKKIYRQTAGVFMNLLCLPFNIHTSNSLQEVIAEVKSRMSAFLRHQRYQFGNLVSDLNLQQQHKLLYHVRVSYEEFDFTSSFAGLHATATAFSNPAETDPLAIYVRDYHGEGFDIRMICNTDYVSREMAHQLSESLEHLILTLTSDKPVHSISLISEAQQQKILQAGRGPVRKYPFSSFQEMWAASVVTNASAIAVTGLTYAQLDSKSRQLAAVIQASRYYKKGGYIALLLPRNEKMIIGILGSMLSGMVYVPADLDYPVSRISYIVDDAGCDIVLTSRDVNPGIPAREIICIEEYEHTAICTDIYPQPEDPCYIIYTSGSTGQPKGVVISHGSLADYVCTFREYFALTAADTVLQQSSFSFDTSVEEIFPILSVGGRLCILENRRDVQSLQRLLSLEKITVLSTTPLVLRYLNDTVMPASLRIVISGGDVLRMTDIDRLLQLPLKVYNTYGPTECTVCATYYEVQPGDISIPAGRAISNRSVYILDTSLNPQPFGIPGEIYLGGAGLATRYIGKPQLTTERFIWHPLLAERLYRTGDIGIMQSDGNILFCNRIDSQLSFRGYRIEAGEIETVVNATEGVEDSRVLVVDINNIPALVAYVKYAGNKQFTRKQWRGLLEDKLPAHMIPEVWVTVPEFPLLQSGKTDTRSLLDIPVVINTNDDICLPTTTLQEEICAIWQEFLSVKNISTDDSFFDLGGHSLNIMQLANKYESAFHATISIEELFRNTTVISHAILIENKIMISGDDIPVTQKADSYQLSDGQMRIWLLSQDDDASRSYHLQGNLLLDERLDPVLFEKAIRQVIDRHEILRTVFRKDSTGLPRQVVLDDCDFELEDIAQPDDLPAAAYKIFDLTRGPLLRAALIRLKNNRSLCWFNMHHIISDGWSMEILHKEVFAHYTALVQKKPLQLPPLRIQYKDYATWQLAILRNQTSQRDYWKQQLSGTLPVLELLAGKSRPAVKTYNGRILATMISAVDTAALRTLCQQNNCTLFMGILGVLVTLLHRYSAQEDLIVGTPVAGRNHTDLEEQVGFYVNTLALRIRFAGTDNFTELLAKIWKTTLTAYDHQSYPFDSLLEELSLKRDISRSALFDVMLVLHNQHNRQDVLQQQDAVKENIITDEGIAAAKFDFTFNFVENFDQLELKVEFNTDIYEKELVTGMMQHFCSIIKAVTTHPEIPLSRLDYLSVAEKKELLEVFNNTVVPVEQGHTLVSLFREQVQLHGSHPVLYFRDRSFSFAEIDVLSSQLSHYLLAEYDLRPEELVAVCLQRSEWLIISLLAVLKAGCAYVPVDPSHPAERINYVIADSGSRIVLDKEEIERFELVQSSYPVTAPEMLQQDSSLAYVIYTSGSTGRPKGCMVEHRSVLNRLAWGAKHYAYTLSDKLLQKTNFTFDVSVFEIFTPLCFGSSLVLCEDEDVYSPERIGRLIASHQITLAHFVPGMLQSFINTDMGGGADLRSLRRVFCSGESLPLSTVTAWYKQVAIPLSNLYGPTEASVEVSYYDIPFDTGLITIGGPVSNTQLYVLDDSQQLLPVGISGELYIGGVQVARGYHNQPELTAARFIPDEFKGSGRLYKTGDRVRWLSDGSIEYIGRMDNQVKLRGYRIEPGEIEHVLTEQPGITAAIVVVHNDMLLGYVEGTCDELLLKKSLQQRLPDYMVPVRIIQVESFPLTGSGKVDRRALPLPDSIIASAYVAPRTSLETGLSVLWKELLKKDDVISVEADFFELGGHSLRLMQLINQYEKLYHVKVSMPLLFRHTTIASHAKLLTGSAAGEYTPILPVGISPDYAVSDGQRRIWILSQLEEASRSYHLGGHLVLPVIYDAGLFEKAVLKIIARHEILRTVFRENADGVLRQLVLPMDEQLFRLEHGITADLPSALEYVRAGMDRQYDLAHGPLLRVSLLMLATGGCVCSFNMHHIISDGWSMELLQREVFAVYEALKGGKPVVLTPLSIQYKDYAAWQQSQQMQLSGAWWREQFAGELPVLELPASHNRPFIKTYNGRILATNISNAATAHLHTYCREHNATLFMGILSVLNVLLYRYSGQEDIIIGSPVAGRNHPELENQVGFYVNTLPLRTRFQGSDNFQTLLENVREATLQAYEHQAYPFDKLVEELSLQRDTARSALFDVMLALQNQQQQKESALSGDTVIDEGVCAAKSDFVFLFVETNAGLDMRVEFNTDIYDHYYVTGLIKHFKQLMLLLTTSPEIPVYAHNYLLPEEQTMLLRDFNYSQANYPENKTIAAVFEQQVKLYPQHTAVVFQDQSLTYLQLHERSNQLAHYLQAHGIGHEDMVAVCIGRCTEMIVAILGVLKAGGAYVPVDPAYPAERKQLMLEETNVKMILAVAATAGAVKTTVNILVLDTAWKQIAACSKEDVTSDATPQSLAYVIYTSGSTGRPKGTLIVQEGIVSLCTAHARDYEISTDSRSCVMASVSFDAIVWEIYAGLLNGAGIYILGEDIRFEEEQLARFYIDNKITHTFVTTGMLPLFTSGEHFRGSALRYLLTGGDQTKLNKQDSYSFRLINMYGPTENTVYTTYYPVGHHPGHELPPIGKPVPNASCYIVDKHMNLCPVGIPGELCVSGPGLARGYLHRPELTAGKFITNPFTGDRMYRTGDLARWLPDGNIEFAGRIDEQVKIRGYRVEPGEIAHILLQTEGIRDAIVVPHIIANAQKCLVAYIVSSDTLTVAGIRRELSETLPDYMVPAYFVQLNSMPLTKNGKVDRTRLPAPMDKLMNTGAEYIAPVSETEKSLVAIFRRVLHHQQIGITDNFYELGGNSMSLMKIRTAIKQELGAPILVKDLMRLQTIEELAVAIDGLKWLQEGQPVETGDVEEFTI